MYTHSQHSFFIYISRWNIRVIWSHNNIALLIKYKTIFFANHAESNTTVKRYILFDGMKKENNMTTSQFEHNTQFDWIEFHNTNQTKPNEKKKKISSTTIISKCEWFGQLISSKIFRFYTECWRIWYIIDSLVYYCSIYTRTSCIQTDESTLMFCSCKEY